MSYIGVEETEAGYVVVCADLVVAEGQTFKALTISLAQFLYSHGAVCDECVIDFSKPAFLKICEYPALFADLLEQLVAEADEEVAA